MKNSLIVSTILFSTIIAKSQNLVKNYSFEEGANCDGTSEIINSCDSWIGIAGEPIFFSRSCPVDPQTLAYIQAIDLPSAFEGKTFLGLGLATEGQFIQGELNKPLKKGVEYRIKASVRFSSKECNTPIQELGILLGNNSFEVDKNLISIDAPEAIALQRSNGGMIEATGEWITVEAYYTAKGDEDQLTLGNFSHLNKGILDDENSCSYLYIDNIEIIPFEEINLDAFSTKTKITPKQRLLLPIEFVNDSYTLSNPKYKLLDNLAKQLNKKEDIYIDILGHTDNSRDEVLSIHLSEQRARSISDYLQQKGVAPERIKIYGMGSSEGLAPNNTPEGQKKNERIEIKLR